MLKPGLKLPHFRVGLSVFAALLALTACTEDRQPNTQPDDTGMDGPPGLSPLSIRDTHWVNAKGDTVLLKGTNLGNWLLQEFWMMGQSTDAVNDQCTLEGILDDRFGFNERERLMDVFRDHWITDRDWNELERFNLNVVRLSFIWNLIEDERNPMQLRDDAWQYLDYAIEQAGARGIYVILDLHGAVGSQGWEHHSGCADQNLYWSNEDYQARTRWLWQQIAHRYKDNPVVAAYGLLNEPWGTTPENLAVEAVELYHAVREVDAEKVVILPGHSAGIEAYDSPADAGLTNIAFEMHFYPGIFGWGNIGYAVHRDWLSCGVDGTSGLCEWERKLTEKNAAFLIGEFQPWTGQGLSLGADITRATYDRYGDLGWAATSWSYKVLTNTGGQGEGTWGMVTNLRPLEPQTPLNFSTASINDIETLFRSFGTLSYDVHHELRAALSSEERSTLFDLPEPPANVALVENNGTVVLTWDASRSEEVTGYNLYRSPLKASGYQLIAENLDALSFVDDTINDAQTFHYRVHAVTERDESLRSDVVSTSIKAVDIPGLIEAEQMTDMAGIQIETCSDVGGGSNVGYVDPNDYLTYQIDVESAGDYQVEYRLASNGGSTGFELQLNGTVIDTQAVADTGGWQSWQTQTGTLSLPAGESTLKIQALGGGWNLNWIRIQAL